MEYQGDRYFASSWMYRKVGTCTKVVVVVVAETEIQ
jgi:hypothetical protein